MKTTQPTARLFCCSYCHQQVVICRRCDRGNINCGSECRRKTSTLKHRLANQKYQSSLKGCLKHAERQRRYRARKRATANKVTDQGSPVLPSRDVLPCRPDKGKSALPSSAHCHLCGAAVCAFLRNGFLQDNPDERLPSWPRGP